MKRERRERVAKLSVRVFARVTDWCDELINSSDGASGGRERTYGSENVFSRLDVDLRGGHK